MRKEDLYSALSALDGELVDAVYDEKHKNVEKLAKRRKRTARIILAAAAAALIAAAIPITAIAMKAPEEQPPAVQAGETKETKSTEQVTTTPENTPTPTETPVTPTPTETPVTPTPTETPTTMTTETTETHQPIQAEPPEIMDYYHHPCAIVRIIDFLPDTDYHIPFSEGTKDYAAFLCETIWSSGRFFTKSNESEGTVGSLISQNQCIFFNDHTAKDIISGDVLFVYFCKYGVRMIDDSEFLFVEDWSFSFEEGKLCIDYNDIDACIMAEVVNEEITRCFQTRDEDLENCSDYRRELILLNRKYYMDALCTMPQTFLVNGISKEELIEIIKWIDINCRCWLGSRLQRQSNIL